MGNTGLQAEEEEGYFHFFFKIHQQGGTKIRKIALAIICSLHHTYS
jgi:hypothetical protein